MKEYLSRKPISTMTYEELYEDAEALRVEMNKKINGVLKQKGN